MEKKVPSETAKSEKEAASSRPGLKRRRRRLGFAAVFSIAVACLVFFVLALALSGRTVPVPEFARPSRAKAGTAMYVGTIISCLLGFPIRNQHRNPPLIISVVVSIVLNKVSLFQKRTDDDPSCEQDIE